MSILEQTSLAGFILNEYSTSVPVKKRVAKWLHIQATKKFSLPEVSESSPLAFNIGVATDLTDLKLHQKKKKKKKKKTLAETHLSVFLFHCVYAFIKILKINVFICM